MLNQVVHIGLTVSDLEKSKHFYGDILGLDYVGELLMEGRATDALFGHPLSNCRVVYYKDMTNPEGPAIELLYFENIEVEKHETSLQTTSVSEVCFAVEDCWAEYRRLKDLGVEFISEPQEFDFSESGFGKSIAVYFKDPDGIIIELIQGI